MLHCPLRHFSQEAKRPLPFTSCSQELTAASQMTAPCRAVRPPSISAERPSAHCHPQDFSHELIAALQAIASTLSRPRSSAAASIRHAPSQEVIPTLRVKVLRCLVLYVLMAIMLWPRLKKPGARACSNAARGNSERNYLQEG